MTKGKGFRRDCPQCKSTDFWWYFEHSRCYCCSWCNKDKYERLYNLNYSIDSNANANSNMNANANSNANANAKVNTNV